MKGMQWSKPLFQGTLVCEQGGMQDCYWKFLHKATWEDFEYQFPSHGSAGILAGPESRTKMTFYQGT